MSLPTAPCEIASETLYNIVRQHIIKHLDNRVAKITSNYNFCFEVCKLIPLYEPKQLTYTNIFGRTKKEREKLHTTIKKYNDFKIFEMTHDNERHSGYTPIPKLVANNEWELKEKLDNLLEYLIELINEPLNYCEHYKGTGIVQDSPMNKIDINKGII